METMFLNEEINITECKFQSICRKKDKKQIEHKNYDSHLN